MQTNPLKIADLFTFTTGVALQRCSWEKVFLGKGVLKVCSKLRCSENIQQIYRRTPLPKRDFNKVAKQLYSNTTSA